MGIENVLVEGGPVSFRAVLRFDDGYSLSLSWVDDPLRDLDLPGHSRIWTGDGRKMVAKMFTTDRDAEGNDTNVVRRAVPTYTHLANMIQDLEGLPSGLSYRTISVVASLVNYLVNENNWLSAWLRERMTSV